MAKKGQKGGEAPGTHDPGRVVQRRFPGPPEANARLRVSFSRQTFGELTAHAKESLEAEVCGVLVGEVCEDDEGLFVDVRATIRGNAAREARAQVTFTHETWNQIHTTLDRDHAGLQIVGWYHTHPGFGVEFSAMDRFIQENFFSGRAQVAFVTDPLGGDVALVYNAGGGIEYLPRFWVDGREHSAKVPGGSSGGGTRAGSTAAVAGEVAPGGDVRLEIERLEGRVNQLIQALDEQRSIFYRMLLTVVVVACTAIICWVGYLIWSDRIERIKPPEPIAFVPLPIKLGNDTIMVGLQVVRWQVPPRLDALLDKAVRAQLEEQRRIELELRELQLERQRELQEQPPPRQRERPRP